MRRAIARGAPQPFNVCSVVLSPELWLQTICQH